MSKYYGMIGYTETTEVDPVNHPGVVEDVITERPYYGDITRSKRNLQNGDQLLPNVQFTNDISILSDPYARLHYGNIRYAEYMGTRWQVVGVEIQYPRLILTLGGEYNGPKAIPSQRTY